VGLNPNQSFTVISITRKQVVSCLNEHLSWCGTGIVLKDDDPSVTDEVCEEYADFLKDAYMTATDEYEHSDLMGQACGILLRRMGFDVPNNPEDPEDD